jgi:hypothetical protein
MVLSGSPKKNDDHTSKEAIAAAKRILNDRQEFTFHSAGKLEAEFVELDLYDFGERFAALDGALDEIAEGDRRGPQPPGDVSSPPYAGNKMYAFIWKSKSFGDIYLKFSFAGTGKMARLVLHSFHKDREKKL